MSKPLLCFLFLMICGKLSAQNLTYYPFNSLLSISSNYQNTLWIDVRMQTNSYFSSLATEIAPAITFKKSKKAAFYTGVGARLNFLAVAAGQNDELLDGYMLNVGVRSQPFEKIPGLMLAFELSPFVNTGFDLGLMRSQIGIGYNFKTKK